MALTILWWFRCLLDFSQSRKVSTTAPTEIPHATLCNTALRVSRRMASFDRFSPREESQDRAWNRTRNVWVHSWKFSYRSH